MRKNPHHYSRRNLLTSLLLALLLFRAYVPVGFMPASGAPFLLELCPDAAPTPMPASMSMSMSMPTSMPALALAHHHDHSGTHGHFQHCPFGSAPAAGPVSQGVLFAPAVQAPPAPASTFRAVHLSARLQRANLPRGPPVHA